MSAGVTSIVVRLGCIVRCRPLWLVAALVVRVASAAGAPVSIAIQVAEPAGTARLGEPVTSGVPLPRGAVREAGRLWLSDAGGRAVPLQRTPLERWPDGSLRWVLLDFPADVAADREAVYTLRQGVPAALPRGAARLGIERAPTGTTFDTGTLRVTVPASGNALASRVLLDGRRVGGAVPLPARADSGPPATQPPRIETEGPVRAEVLLAGRWSDGVAYEARLAAFAGSSALRLRYTLTHTGQPGVVPIPRLGVAVLDEMRSGAIGLGGVPHRFDPLVERHALRLHDARDARLDGAVAQGTPDCWVSGRSAAANVILVSPFCWQQYPQELALSPGGVRVDLFAGGKDPVRLGRGAAKTHEVWIVVRPPGAADPPERIAAALAAPLAAHVDADWVVATRALQGALAPGDPGADSFLQRLRDAVRRYRARADAERWDDGPPVACDARGTERPRTGFYGTLNWGDWNFPGYHDRAKGCDAWGNLEYDLPQVLGLGWVATGSRAMWDAFLASVLHYRDVDIIHHDPEYPDRIGLNHPHKVGHFAPEAKQNVDLGHAWLEGLITHYRLTGDPRSRDAALAMGDALARRLGKAGNPRQFGWPMIALAALADSTGEARYRDAAVRFATPALTAFDPTPAAADWKVGILADGLAAVQAVSPEPQRLDWLTRYADALLAAPMDRYPDARYALPLGVLAAWTGDARYRARALDVAAGLGIGDWGKTLALGGRTGFRLLSPLAAPPARSAVIPARAAPRPPSAGAR